MPSDLEQKIAAEVPKIVQRYRWRFGDAARDIAQETACRLLAGLRRGFITPAKDIGACANRTAACVVIDWARYRACRPPELPAGSRYELASYAPGFDVRLERAQLLAMALKSVTPARRAVMARYLRGDKLRSKKEHSALFHGTRQARRFLGK